MLGTPIHHALYPIVPDSTISSRRPMDDAAGEQIQAGRGHDRCLPSTGAVGEPDAVRREGLNLTCDHVRPSTADGCGRSRHPARDTKSLVPRVIT